MINESSDGEAVLYDESFHDYFKVEREKMVQLEGEREYVQSCAKAG